MALGLVGPAGLLLTPGSAWAIPTTERIFVDSFSFSQRQTVSPGGSSTRSGTIGIAAASHQSVFTETLRRAASISNSWTFTTVFGQGRPGDTVRAEQDVNYSSNGGPVAWTRAWIPGYYCPAPADSYCYATTYRDSTSTSVETSLSTGPVSSIRYEMETSAYGNYDAHVDVDTLGDITVRTIVAPTASALEWRENALALNRAAEQISDILSIASVVTDPALVLALGLGSREALARGSAQIVGTVLASAVKVIPNQDLVKLAVDAQSLIRRALTPGAQLSTTLSALGFAASVLAVGAEYFANDPADPNFLEPTIPEFPTLSVGELTDPVAAAALGATNDLLRAIAALGALTAAAERFEGALQAGDPGAAAAQLASFEGLRGTLIDALDGAVASVTDLQGQLASQMSDITFDQQIAEDLFAYIATNGIPDDLLASITSIDYDSFVLNIPTSFALDINDYLWSGSLTDQFAGITSALSGFSAAARSFVVSPTAAVPSAVPEPPALLLTLMGLLFLARRALAGRDWARDGGSGGALLPSPARASRAA